MMKPVAFASFALLAIVVQAGCSSRKPATGGVAPAPIDSAGEQDSVGWRRDTVPSRSDTNVSSDTTTPRRDSVAAQPDNAAGPGSNPGGPRVNQVEYEGWRQYSVNCARCHGQDVLPNPVAANLLVSLAAGGPINSEQGFTQVVTDGRPHRGMPAFKGVLTPAQISATYAYVKGRADKRIPPGRPQQPS